MNDRLRYIDFIRAYAIFLVTGFHLWRFFGGLSIEFYKYDLFAIFAKGGGVKLFFLISGYSMAVATYKGYDTHKKIDWQEYFLKRISRIVPAYYIAILIWSILIYNGIAPKPIGLIDQISHLLFIHTFNPNTYFSISGVFWSLGIEMQFYFLLPLFLFLIIRFPVFAIFLAIFPLFYNVYIHKHFLLKTSVLAYFIYFILGYISFVNKDYLYNKFFDNRYKFFVLFFFGTIFIHFTFYNGYILTGQFHMLIWTISFIPIFLYLSKSVKLQTSENKVLKLFIFTGTASYSIYLYNYVFYIHKVPFSQSIEALIFYILLVYLTGVSAYYLIERPFQNLRKKLLAKKTQSH